MILCFSVQAKHKATEQPRELPSEVAQEAIAGTIPEADSRWTAPRRQNIARVVRRIQAKARPQDPADTDFALDLEWLSHNCDNLQLLGDLRIHGGRILMWTSDFLLATLATRKLWLADGTFKVRHNKKNYTDQMRIIIIMIVI